MKALETFTRTRPKPIITEMGGKNPAIIMANADLGKAAAGVMRAAFGYGGQKCSACSRAIVLASRYDAFLERLVEATRSLTIAPAEEPGCGVGPVIDAESKNRILAAMRWKAEHLRSAH